MNNPRDTWDDKVQIRLHTKPASLGDAARLAVDRPHTWSVTESVALPRSCISCPVCGFSFCAAHTDVPRAANYTCPQCEGEVLKLEARNLQYDAKVFQNQRDGMQEQTQQEKERNEQTRARLFDEHQAVLRRARLAYTAATMDAGDALEYARVRAELGAITRVLLEVVYAGIEREMPTDPAALAEDMRRRLRPLAEKL